MCKKWFLITYGVIIIWYIISFNSNWFQLITLYLADSYFHDKMKGIAKFVHDHIVMSEDGKLLYKCYDVSRGIFKYKDDKGNEIKDVKALKLIKILQSDLMKQANVLYKYFDEYCEDLNKKLSYDSISDDDKEDARKELSTMKMLKNKALNIGFEINTMEQNNTFSNELAILTSWRN